MKCKNLFIIALLMIAGLSSCKKETTITPVNPATPVATNDRFLLSYIGTNASMSFEYNADKTIKSYTMGGNKWEFNYQPNKLTVTVFVNGQKGEEMVYELSNGIAQKRTDTNFGPNGVVTDVYVALYNYNASGLLAKEVYSKNGAPNGSTEWTYDNNGDLSALFIKDVNGNTTWSSTYTYELALLDKSFSFGQFNSYGQGSVFPKKAKHLIKQQVMVDNNGTTTFNYTYTLDAQGYVLSGLVKDNANVTVHSWTNTWQ